MGKRLRISPEGREIWRLIACSLIIGLAAGYAAIAFAWLMRALTAGLTEGWAGYTPLRYGERMLAEGRQFSAGPLNRWVWFFLPSFGGLLGGWLVFRFAPEAEGHGTDAAIKAYHHRNGQIRARVPLIKAVASALTIGTGGSAGAEGPIVQIGAGLGSILSRLLRLNPVQSRILLAAGMAAGVGAVFRAPTAAALFAAEVLYRDMDLEFEVIIPCVVASIMAYAVYTMHLGRGVLFATPLFRFHGLTDLLPYLLMGAVMAGGAYVFVKVFYGIRDLFARLPIRPVWKPVLGGLLVGVIGLFMPEVLGQSYGIVQRALLQGTELQGMVGLLSIRFLLLVALFKTLATAFSIGSGGSGGIFGPSLVVGAALGAAYGLGMQWLLPGMSIRVGAFALVGMAGFFAAASNAPISTIIMVSELTGNYALLVPAMWVSIFAYVLARRYSIYEHQVKNRLEAPIHQGSMVTATLRNATVSMALAHRTKREITRVDPGTPLPVLSKLFAHSILSSIPVTSADGVLLGTVLEVQLREALNEFDARPPGRNGTLNLLSRFRRRFAAGSENLPPHAAALRVEAASVRPDDSLFDALHLMSENNLTEIAVVAPDGSNRLVEVLSNHDITAYYHTMLAMPRSAQA